MSGRYLSDSLHSLGRWGKLGSSGQHRRPWQPGILKDKDLTATPHSISVLCVVQYMFVLVLVFVPVLCQVDCDKVRRGKAR